MQFRNDQFNEVLKAARADQRVEHVAAGAGNTGVLFDPIGHLLRRSHQNQITAPGDIGKALFDIAGGQGLATAIRTHHIGSHAFGVSGQRVAVRVAADVDTGITGITHQLRLQVIVALQFVIFALGFDLGPGRDDAKYRQ
ncbi:hypothetical protein D3C71_593940 [compost metagenome]